MVDFFVLSDAAPSSKGIQQARLSAQTFIIFTVLASILASIVLFIMKQVGTVATVYCLILKRNFSVVKWHVYLYIHAVLYQKIRLWYFQVDRCRQVYMYLCIPRDLLIVTVRLRCCLIGHFVFVCTYVHCSDFVPSIIFSFALNGV